MTNHYEELNKYFLELCDELKDDQIFFHFELMPPEMEEKYGVDYQLLMDIVTWSGITKLEVEKNLTSEARKRLVAARMDHVCESAICRLQEIQEKLKGEINASNKT
jgi:hypothetical protein